MRLYTGFPSVNEVNEQHPCDFGAQAGDSATKWGRNVLEISFGYIRGFQPTSKQLLCGSDAQIRDSATKEGKGLARIGFQLYSCLPPANKQLPRASGVHIEESATKMVMVFGCIRDSTIVASFYSNLQYR